MNKVILIGNICSEIECRTTQSGKKHVSFRLAVNRDYKNANGEREADYLTIIAWNQTAELIERYCIKGSRIAVDGEIQTRSYTAQDGGKRYAVEVKCNSVQFLFSMKSEDSADAAPRANAPAHQMGFTEVDTDELPF